MTFRYLETTAAEFDDRVAHNPDGGTMFGLAEYGMAKRKGGWDFRLAECDDVALLILQRTVPGLGKLWVLPKGPGVTDAGHLSTLMPQIAAAARSDDAFMVKIEPELRDTQENRRVLDEGGCLDAGFLQNNNHTMVMDLHGSRDEVFARIPKKRRYDIRRAERDGVEVRQAEATDADFEIMHALWMEVNDDHGIAPRPKDYMFNFWRTYLHAGLGGMFIASVEDRPVAAAFGVTHGQKSIYKDGASVRQRPVQGASHLLQWKLIEWAHERGSLSHDLCGTPPSDQLENKDHPFYGLGQFKRAFASETIDWVGAWDLPLQRRRYDLWVRYGMRLWRQKRLRIDKDPYFY